MSDDKAKAPEVKVFADLVKGDQVEVKKDPRKPGILKKVTAIKSNKYGLKFRLEDGFGAYISRDNAENLTEYFDRRQRYVFCVVQPETKPTK